MERNLRRTDIIASTKESARYYLDLVNQSKDELTNTGYFNAIKKIRLSRQIRKYQKNFEVLKNESVRLDLADIESTHNVRIFDDPSSNE